MIWLCFFSCHTEKKAAVNSGKEMQREINFGQGELAIVYKTKRDFYDKIPITMNDERTQIVAYPAPTDVFRGGQLALPTLLKNGYLLDNRGINKNTVFLDYNYLEYSQLKSAPSFAEMMNRILEKYPLIEMYNCGVRYQYKNEIEELNLLIDNQFKNCKAVIK
jgi:hypothetical protein